MSIIMRMEKQKALIQTAFALKYLILFPEMNGTTCYVYEAPAASAWVVIAADQAWVAEAEDEFVFWGPLGKKPIVFPVPEGWPK